VTKLPEKNINMIFGHFHEKAFTEVSYLERVCMDFKGDELGFTVLKKRNAKNFTQASFWSE